jgi:protein-disulfide isomerase
MTRPSAALALPLLALLAACASTRVPAVVDAERARTPRGQITVVEFIDFECPYCRSMNAVLAPLLAEKGANVRVVRKQVPLTRIHAFAMDAARVSVCADGLGRGDAVADALYRAPPQSLTKDGAVAIGVAAGLDAAALRTCVDDPATDARIQGDTESFFVGADGDGVPTVWIDDRVFVGVVARDALASAIDHALARVRVYGP